MRSSRVRTLLAAAFLLAQAGPVRAGNGSVYIQGFYCPSYGGLTPGESCDHKGGVGLSPTSSPSPAAATYGYSTSGRTGYPDSTKGSFTVKWVVCYPCTGCTLNQFVSATGYAQIHVSSRHGGALATACRSFCAPYPVHVNSGCPPKASLKTCGFHPGTCCFSTWSGYNTCTLCTGFCSCCSCPYSDCYPATSCEKPIEWTVPFSFGVPIPFNTSTSQAAANVYAGHATGQAYAAIGFGVMSP